MPVVRCVFLLLLLLSWTCTALPESATSLQELAAPCLACHSLEPDGSTHVGPSLAQVAGRRLAGDPNYTYSEAFTQRASQSLVWDRQTLDRFIEHPQTMVPGTAMSYPGVADPVERMKLVDWLMTDPAARAAELRDANYSRDPAVQAVLELTPDREYGDYLAGECLTCHQSGDTSGRVPPIHGLTADYFIFALLEYRNGARDNRVMQVMSGPLGNEELAALTAVFAQQK